MTKSRREGHVAGIACLQMAEPARTQVTLEPARRTPRDRHRTAVLDIEVRRLLGELRAIGPVPRRAFSRRLGAARWREGSLDAAIEHGVRQGVMRRLPLGFAAAARGNGRYRDASR